MLRTFMLVALRNFRKNTLSTTVNSIGLILGFSTFVVLSLYVYNEVSYDRWHEKSPRTYRFTTIDKALGVSSNQVAITNPMMPQAAEDNIPEVEISSRVLYSGEQRMEIGDQGHYTEYAMFVENDFFEIFDLTIDNREVTLQKFNQPHKLILTKNYAEKVFGKERDPMGELFTINDDSWEVVGLMDNVSNNSHLGFDVLMSLHPAQSDSSLTQYLNSWSGLGMIGYAVLTPGASQAEVESKLSELALANDVNDFWVPQLQPLEAIHLESSGIIFDYYHINKGDKVYVYALGGVALFVLLIAAFNFINLTTAQSTSRAKEVGVRRVVGSTKGQLIAQHMTESVILSLFSMCASIVLTAALSKGTGVNIGYDMIFLLSSQPIIVVGFIGTGIFIGLLAGVYPSFILSSIKSANILRGRFQTSSKGVWLRKSLVVMQFIAAIGMICTTLFVARQIDFIKNKSLGFNKEQIININTADQGLSNKLESFRQAIKSNPNILSVSLSNNMPGSTFGRSGVNLEGRTEEDPWIVSVMSMNEDYLQTMGIELAAGRNYDPSYGSDQQESIIINEAMMKSLNWDEAVGKKLVFGNNTTRTVVGVIKDFHFTSMRHRIEPLMVFYNPGPNSNLNIKLAGGNVRETVEFIESTWAATYPNYPIDYQFFDQEFDQIFTADELFGRLVGTFTWLSIILSGLGLFGLSFFMVEQRKKEIGVRKVLGSSIRQIVQLLMKEFVWLIALANIIAWPVAYLFTKRWISDFQYRIDLFSFGNISIYIMAAVGALLIAVLAVSYKSISAAMMNPVKSLRDE